MLKSKEKNEINYEKGNHQLIFMTKVQKETKNTNL